MAFFQEVMTEAIRQAVFLPAAERKDFLGRYLTAMFKKEDPPMVSQQSSLDRRAMAHQLRRVLQPELHLLGHEVTLVVNATIRSNSRHQGSLLLGIAQALIKAPKRATMAKRWKRLKFYMWTSSLVDSDPRHMILHYFHPGDEQGPAGRQTYGRDRTAARSERDPRGTAPCAHPADLKSAHTDHAAATALPTAHPHTRIPIRRFAAQACSRASS